MEKITIRQLAILQGLITNTSILAQDIINCYTDIPPGEFKDFINDFGASISALKVQAQDKLRLMQENCELAQQFTEQQ